MTQIKITATTPDLQRIYKLETGDVVQVEYESKAFLFAAVNGRGFKVSKAAKRLCAWGNKQPGLAVA